MPKKSSSASRHILCSGASLIATLAAITPVELRANAARPPLRASIAEGLPPASTATTTAMVRVMGGYTTNAGPTLDEVQSPVVDSTVEITHLRRGSDSELELGLALRDQEFTRKNEARNLDYKITGSYTWKPEAGMRASTTALLLKSTEVDEKVSQSGIEQTLLWERGKLTPFLKSSIHYLDYSDISSFLLEFGNQDDRDRVSAASQFGLRYTLSDGISATAGFGVDTKRYATARDDFGLRRDNFSLYPIVGLAYSNDDITAEILYSPIYRHYEDPYFGSVYAHTLTALADWRALPYLRFTGAARLGLDETDFLDALGVEELTLLGGVTLTGSDLSSIGLEAVYTRKDFLGLARIDNKIEFTLRGQQPISKTVAFTGEIKYLDFKSTFADTKTDMMQVLFGFSYKPEI